MRPERILSELRQAVPEDGFIVTDVGWNKNGVGAAVPDHGARHVHHAERPGDDGLRPGGGARRQDWRSRIAPPSRSSATAASAPTRRSSRPPWKPTSPSSGSSWTTRRSARSPASTNMHYGWELRLPVRARRQPYRADFAPMARALRRRRRGHPVRRRARSGAPRGARLRPADGDPGADGKRADADARALGHQRRLPEGQLAPLRRPSVTSTRRRTTCAGSRSWRSSPSGP